MQTECRPNNNILNIHTRLRLVFFNFLIVPRGKNMTKTFIYLLIYLNIFINFIAQEVLKINEKMYKTVRKLVSDFSIIPSDMNQLFSNSEILKIYFLFLFSRNYTITHLFYFTSDEFKWVYVKISVIQSMENVLN